MSYLNVKNRAKSLLAAAMLSTDTSLTITTGDGVLFPAVPFHITITDEILEVTAVATDTFTVTRAVEGTTAAAHSVGDTVELRITAAIIRGLERGAGRINVETLTADKTLVAGTDPLFQNLDTNGANRTITLDTASAVAGDRFVIKNTAGSSSSYYLLIEQGTTVLDVAYAQGTKAFVFDGTNWVGADNGVTDKNVQIGYNAQSYSGGIAIGNNAQGYANGAAVGNNSNGDRKSVV